MRFLVPAALVALGFSAWTGPTRAAEPADKPAVREVIVVFKTHFDIGYTDLASKVVERYRTGMIDQALRVVDASAGLPPEQRFVWTLPGWPLAKIAGEGQTAERQARVIQALRDGRFAVHALPFTLHTELLEPEDLVHGLTCASRLSREAGLPLPRDAKMTDVPCHSWVLPTLLKHAGVEFLHLGCNSASSSPEVPELFWWEGPDGSRVLTMYSAAGYGTGLAPPKGWPYRTWLALEHTGDNHGPPTPEEVTRLRQRAARELPGVAVRIGRLSDFADALRAEKRDIPVVRGDMPDSWIHGPLSDPGGAILARNTRPAIAAAEALCTLLDGWGVKGPDSAGALADAREGSLLYGEHTWGGALYWVTRYGKDLKWSYGKKWRAERAAGRFKRLEESWAEHTAYVTRARDRALPVRDGALAMLARSAGAEGPRVVVFNPLPRTRDGEVRLRVPDGAGDIRALRPADGGAAVPVAREGDLLVFVARDVPAGGYRTFVPAPEAKSGAVRADGKAGVIENEYLRVTLDPARGAVRSVIDKATGRELADAGSGFGFGQYLYERYDADRVASYVRDYVKTTAEWGTAELGKPNLPPAKDVPYRAASPRDAHLQVAATPVAATATLHTKATAELPHAVTTRVVLYAGRPYLDLKVTVHDKPADNWPEAGWIVVPVRADKPRFRLGRLGGVTDPARDFVPGSNRDVQAVNTGLTITDADGRGVGLCPVDSPLVSLDRPGLFRYTPKFVPEKPVALVNVFNNQWTTNFRMWNEGTWTSRVRVWAAAGDEATGPVVPALEARQPMLAAFADGPAGPLPAVRAGVAVSRPGVLVSRYGPNPDGPGTVLRLWEHAGAGGPCEVTVPLPIKAVQPVDLRGRPTGPALGVRDGRFTTPLPAYAPASYLILAGPG